MIYKWCEIDLEMFEEIFNEYVSLASWSVDKVLEVQNIPSIILGQRSDRFYLGNGIKLLDWVSWNEESIMLIDSFNNAFPGIKDTILDKSKLSTCSLCNSEPKITPMGIDVHFKILWNTYFGQNFKIENKFIFKGADCDIRTDLWFTKSKADSELITYRPGKTRKLDNSQKFVRIRAIDLGDWKEMINNYLKYDNDVKYLRCEEDLETGRILL